MHEKMPPGLAARQKKATTGQAPGRKAGCQLAAGINPQTWCMKNPLKDRYG